METTEESVVFVCVAFGDKYVAQQERLRASIFAIYPNANLMFFTECLPPGSQPFQDSLYGFKVHAIQAAIDKGFKKVIFLDPAMILMDKVDDLFEYYIVAVKDDHKLHPLVSDNALRFYQTPRHLVEALEWHLVGGSIYYFNFLDMRVRSIFDLWKRSEKAGCFGSQYEAASEQINGHRNDESCMALAMQGHRMMPQPGPDVRYCIEKNPMFIKKHFK